MGSMIGIVITVVVLITVGGSLLGGSGDQRYTSDLDKLTGQILRHDQRL